MTYQKQVNSDKTNQEIGIQLLQLLKEVIKQELEITLSKSNKNSKPFMKITEAANYLGLAKKTLYNYNVKKMIAHHKIGKTVYYDVNDLNDFVLNKKNRIKSDEELERDIITDRICRR